MSHDELDLSSVESSIEELERKRVQLVRDTETNLGRTRKTREGIKHAERALVRKGEKLEACLKELKGEDEPEEEEEQPAAPQTPPTEPTPPPAPPTEPAPDSIPFDQDTDEEPEEPEEPEQPTQATPRWKQELRKWLPWILAAVVAIVIFVIMNRNLDTILGWAAGDADWQENGLVRFLLVMAPTAIAGYWAWILSPRE